jgi:hypothetical protein
MLIPQPSVPLGHEAEAGESSLKKSSHLPLAHFRGLRGGEENEEDQKQLRREDGEEEDHLPSGHL